MVGNKEQFIQLYKKYITRKSSDKLLTWLTETDFFTAPASTRFHNSFDGGLVEHSINVYNRLSFNLGVDTRLAQFDEKAEYPGTESVAIVSLLHDVCKVNYYKIEMRNAKENGTWVQKPYYTVDDKLPYGHGEKSVYIIREFMKLTAEEALAINWHMGGFDDRVKGGSYALSNVFSQNPLALALHIADMQATHLDERIKNNAE